MCGICGIKLPTTGPIGRHLVDMCQAMHRDDLPDEPENAG